MERFRGLTQQFCRVVDGLIVVCDITEPHTISAAMRYYLNFSKMSNTLKPFIFVGNKTDQTYDNKDKTEIIRVAEDLDCGSYFTSAKSGENVKEIFQKLTNLMLDELKQKMMGTKTQVTDASVILGMNDNKKKKKKKNKSCC